MSEPTKPDGFDDEHREYLNNLRDSGITNMMGAAAFLREEFSLDRKTADAYLMYWVQTV